MVNPLKTVMLTWTLCLNNIVTPKPRHLVLAWTIRYILYYYKCISRAPGTGYFEFSTLHYNSPLDYTWRWE